MKERKNILKIVYIVIIFLILSIVPIVGAISSKDKPREDADSTLYTDNSSVYKTEEKKGESDSSNNVEYSDQTNDTSQEEDTSNENQEDNSNQSSDNSASKKYTVKQGDSMYGIATRNQLTVAELQKLNPGVTTILPGQDLNV